MDKTPAVPFEHVWLELLHLGGDIISLELDNHAHAQLLDMSGLDYIVHLPDNRLLAVAYRCLEWCDYFTFTFSDMGLERLSEWDRLALDPARWMKPQVYAICYHTAGTPVRAAAILTADLVQNLDRSQTSVTRNRSNGRRFRHTPVWRHPTARVWPAQEGGES